MPLSKQNKLDTKVYSRTLLPSSWIRSTRIVGETGCERADKRGSRHGLELEIEELRFRGKTGGGGPLGGPQAAVWDGPLSRWPARGDRTTAGRQERGGGVSDRWWKKSLLPVAQPDACGHDGGRFAVDRPDEGPVRCAGRSVGSPPRGSIRRCRPKRFATRSAASATARSRCCTSRRNDSSTNGSWQPLARLHVSLFAIDEAHCISQWGHNFRPDYLKLAELAKELSAERVLALDGDRNARSVERHPRRVSDRTGRCDSHQVLSAQPASAQQRRQLRVSNTKHCSEPDRGAAAGLNAGLRHLAENGGRDRRAIDGGWVGRDRVSRRDGH